MSSPSLFSQPQSQSVSQPEPQSQGQEQREQSQSLFSQPQSQSVSQSQPQEQEGSQSQPEKKTLIKLTILCYRNPSLSESEFHHHWTNIHAPKVSAHLAKFGILSYRQFHTPTHLRTLLTEKVPSLGITATTGDKWADYDGYVELLMPELECYERARTDEYYKTVVEEDEKVFADMQGSRVAVGVEEVWVRDGKVVGR